MGIVKTVHKSNIDMHIGYSPLVERMTHMPPTLYMLMTAIERWFQFLTYFVAAKTLIKDKSFSLREIAYISGAALLISIVRTYPLFSNFHLGIQLTVMYPVAFNLILVAVRVLTITLVFIYLYKIKSYTIKKAIVLTIFADLFQYVTIIFRTYVAYYFMTLDPEWRSLNRSRQMITINLLGIIFIVLMALIAVTVFKKLRVKINNSPTLLTALMLGSLFSWGSIMVVSQAFNFTEHEISWWGIYYTVGYIGFSIFSFFFYENALNAKYNLRQREDEQKHMSFYLDEIEQQQAAMRKFKHDLQNLFSALDIFIKDDDLKGLKQFYPKVRMASEVITKNEFMLDGLSKIKIREIKNILIAKLAMAQNLEIDTRLEVGSEINDITVDTIAMVRILGIILDNAIEELQALGEGALYIVCIKSEDIIRFTIQNSCRLDMPPLKQLQESGFSTKGEGRGLGLSNLYEVIDAQPRLSLMTNIEDGQFSQTLIVERDNG